MVARPIGWDGLFDWSLLGMGLGCWVWSPEIPLPEFGELQFPVGIQGPSGVT
jgi:hypothetical protein